MPETEALIRYLLNNTQINRGLSHHTFRQFALCRASAFDLSARNCYINEQYDIVLQLVYEMILLFLEELLVKTTRQIPE